MPYGKEYDNKDDAAAAASMALAGQPRVKDVEYITVLVRDKTNGRIRREDIQTQDDNRGSSWSGYPHGPIVGIVHSHPAAKTGQKYPKTMFSDTDVNSAIDSNATMYLSAQDEKNGPAKDRKYNPRPSHRNMKKEGEEYLAQFPIEEMKLNIAKRIHTMNFDPATKAQLLYRLLDAQPAEVAGLFNRPVK